MLKTLGEWPALTELTAQLTSKLPPPVGGFHSLSFDGGAVTLLLLYGDSTHAYTQLNARVDAWFLDGFTPSRNPGMWTDDLFSQFARLSHHRTTLATFTAAGAVRRSLEAVGFSIKKRKGYRHKRDMMTATFPGGIRLADKALQAKSVAVIGGGLAGCSVAYSLAKRGISVTLFEAAEHPASQASGVPAAVTRPFLDKGFSPASRLSVDGFHYTLQLLKEFGLLKPQGALWLNQMAWPELAEPIASQHPATEHCDGPALHFPNAQTTNIRAFCDKLIAHDEIELRPQTEVLSVHANDLDWAVASANQSEHFSEVVICSGKMANELLTQDSGIRSRPIRGQLSGYKSQLSLPHIVCGNGHIAKHEERIWLGASFVPDDESCDIRNRDREIYQAKVAELTGGWSNQLLEAPRLDWVGTRHATADHLPYAGQLVDTEMLRTKHLRTMPKRGDEINPEARVKGLFVSVAHGSRGTVTAPICGEMIAAQINNDALPLPSPVRRAIDPGRESVKAIKQE